MRDGLRTHNMFMFAFLHCLSGFLSAYFLFQQLQRTCSFAPLLSGYYIHRYLRLTPIYLFWMLMYWKLSHFIGMQTYTWHMHMYVHDEMICHVTATRARCW